MTGFCFVHIMSPVKVRPGVLAEKLGALEKQTEETVTEVSIIYNLFQL